MFESYYEIEKMLEMQMRDAVHQAIQWRLVAALVKKTGNRQWPWHL